MSKSLHNLIEPPNFAALFAAHPPAGFTILPGAADETIFRMRFNLLTTLDENLLKKLQRLPFYNLCARLVTLSTCFCGNTVTEYAPIPAGGEPETYLDYLCSHYGRSQTLLIVKDIPIDSPLLLHEDNLFAKAFTLAAEERGFISVEGQALAYVPIDFSDTQEYMERLSKSRRKDIRRKLKSRNNIEVHTVSCGESIFFERDFLKQMYSMYLAVYEQSTIHFDLLSEAFFTELLQMRNNGGIVFLYYHQEVLIGYNICLVYGSMLIDKYIGFSYPAAKEHNLYFISWIENLSYAVTNGLSVYIAGWTDPQVKKSLGASFTFTRHLVWVRNPLLRRLLSYLRPMFEADSRIITKAVS